MSAYDDNIKDNLKGQISEHYDNYVIVLLEPSGDIHVDYPSLVIGKALLAEGLKTCIKAEQQTIIFFEEEEESPDE